MGACRFLHWSPPDDVIVDTRVVNSYSLVSVRPPIKNQNMRTGKYSFTKKHCLDYCNQLFVGVSGQLQDKLQFLQNAAARLVMGARKFDRIKPVMRQLHWLPVRQRLRFKTAFLVFNCLRGLAPVYLVDYCKLTSANTGRSHLWSANLCQLSVPRTSTSYGDRSFAVWGPSTWNSLPAALRSTDVSIETFRTQLKTFLFKQ